MKPIKDDNFKSSFMELYINKYSFWEEMINIKNVQNRPYIFYIYHLFSKLILIDVELNERDLKIFIFLIDACYCNTDDGFDRETLHIQTFLELVRVNSLPPNIDLTLPKVFLNTSWMFTTHMLTLERWNTIH